MRTQTIESTLAFLHLLEQPAFCVSDEGQVYANEAARHLTPRSGQTLAQWLGDAAPAYDRWIGTGVLSLQILAAGRPVQARLTRLQDGVLVLLSQAELRDASALTVASQVLRQPLADLSGQLQHLADDQEDLPLIGAMQRQIYRISRLAANLADLEQLTGGTAPLHLQQLSIPEDLEPFLEELTVLCREAGRPLVQKLPKKSAAVYADLPLLKRGLLNLISNAVKFSPGGSPLALRIDFTASHLLFQIENCSDEPSAELLRSAFRRMEERGLIPDPRWGLGVGLPMTQAIARLHGGMVAMEARACTITVSFSVSRRKPASQDLLHSPCLDYTGGMRQSLLELADILPNILYQKDAL